jgi:hypothetical protein
MEPGHWPGFLLDNLGKDLKTICHEPHESTRTRIASEAAPGRLPACDHSFVFFRGFRGSKSKEWQ